MIEGECSRQEYSIASARWSILRPSATLAAVIAGRLSVSQCEAFSAITGPADYRRSGCRMSALDFLAHRAISLRC
jgi:hypothetical protein